MDPEKLKKLLAQAYRQTLATVGVPLQSLRDDDPIDAPTDDELTAAREAGEILVYGPIVDDDTAEFLSWFGIAAMTGAAFRRAMKEIKGAVTVRINSPGGDVAQASLIQGAIYERTEQGHDVRGIVEGTAFSAAALICLPMSHVSILQMAEMMIHCPSSCVCGDARDFRSMLSRLESIETELVGVYAERMGKTEADTLAILQATTFFSSSEAVDANLADEVIKSSQRKPADGDGGDGGRVQNQDAWAGVRNLGRRMRYTTALHTNP